MVLYWNWMGLHLMLSLLTSKISICLENRILYLATLDKYNTQMHMSAFYRTAWTLVFLPKSYHIILTCKYFSCLNNVSMSKWYHKQIEQWKMFAIRCHKLVVSAVWLPMFIRQILHHHVQLIQGLMQRSMYWQPLVAKRFVSIHGRVVGLYITHHAQNPAVTNSSPNSASMISDHKAGESIVGWHDWPSVLHLIYAVERGRC